MTLTPLYYKAMWLSLIHILEEKGAGCALETTPGLHRWATWEPFLADVAARLGAHLA